MPSPIHSRRRIAGVSLLSVGLIIAILYALRRIPPGGFPTSPSTAEHPSASQPVQPAPPSSSSRKPVQRAPRLSAQAYTTAAAQIIQMPEGDARLDALAELMETWAIDSPHGAGQWVGSLPEGTFRTDAAGELLLRWAAADGPAAWAWLTQSPSLSPETLSTLTSAWSQHTPVSASRMAASLTDPQHRLAALTAVAGAWAVTEPAVAATWVETLPPSDRLLTATRIAAIWGEKDGPAAAAWLLRLAGADHSTITAPAAILAEVWTETDPSAVSRWLNNLPPGQTREAAATSFAGAAAAIAPTDALLWAKSLSQDTSRVTTVVDVCEKWFEAAPEEFRIGIEAELTAMPELTMRKAVYAMLYEKDPGFKESLLDLVEQPVPVAPPPPPPSTEPIPTPPPTPAEDQPPFPE